MDLNVAVIITLISLSVTGEGSKTLTQGCLQLPKTEDDLFGRPTFWNFHPSSGSLTFDLSGVVEVSSNCSVVDASNLQHLVRVDLVTIL
jgi:hypothetical protein